MAVEEARGEVVLKSMAFTSVGDLLVLFHSSASPSDDEWNCWVEHARRSQCRAVLVASEGGAPNSAQRARLTEMLNTVNQGPRPIALLTDSAMVRSVMTAVSWLVGKRQALKALPRSDVEEAVAWLGVPVPVARVRETLHRVSSALDASLASSRR